MTKRRLPLTFENALTLVASVLGWPEVARLCRREERCCRNWSDPDTEQGVTLDAALRLDVAFHAAGGEGTPFLDCYRTRIDAEQLAAVPGREALLAAAGKAAKESGEAVASALTAALPSACPADFVVAEREHEEAIRAHTAALAALRARREHVDGARLDGSAAPTSKPDTS